MPTRALGGFRAKGGPGKSIDGVVPANGSMDLGGRYYFFVFGNSRMYATSFLIWASARPR
jgi:hypothetical protein